MQKELIAFFSRSGGNYVNGSVKNLFVGNTEIVARLLQKLTGAELFKIEPVTPYSGDYYVCINQARRDLQKDSRPELNARLEKLDDFQIIYLGYPIYWETMPVAVFSFLEQFCWAGKTILPFCTHEGSVKGRSEADLRRTCPDAIILEGLAIRGADARLAVPAISEWLNKLNNETKNEHKYE